MKATNMMSDTRNAGTTTRKASRLKVGGSETEEVRGGGFLQSVGQVVDEIVRIYDSAMNGGGGY